jgi:hypothetical protein
MILQEVRKSTSSQDIYAIHNNANAVSLLSIDNDSDGFESALRLPFDCFGQFCTTEQGDLKGWSPMDSDEKWPLLNFSKTGVLLGNILLRLTSFVDPKTLFYHTDLISAKKMDS